MALLMFLVLLFFHSNVLLITSQPQNIETFYPYPLLIHPSPPTASWPPPLPPHRPPSPLPVPPPSLSSPPSSTTTIGKVVAATAVGSAALAGLLFFVLRRCMTARQERPKGGSQVRQFSSIRRSDFSRFDGVVKGMIVDENGLDIFYWRKLKSLEGWASYNGRSNSFIKARDLSLNPLSRISSKRAERGMIPSSPSRKHGEAKKEASEETKQEVALFGGQIPEQYRTQSPRSLPGQQEELPKPVATSPPIPSQAAEARPPPPPVPPAVRGTSQKEPPLPPPLPSKAIGLPKPPPPPPFKTGGLAKPPPPPPLLPGKAAKKGGKVRESSAIGGPKLKPLHWEKVEVNGDHSMVWDNIQGGSFRVDGDLMESLFGSATTNQKTPQETGSPSKMFSNSKPNTSAKIFILEPRKSQNIAIILKSLGASLKEILDALSEGQGLTADTLEKLGRIILTEEEHSKIAKFDDDTSKLADAESFLYNILRPYPSAFTCFRAMLFKLNYDSEIGHLVELIQTLELACEELRSRGIFVKLLEAILKAGNRMNAGTNRGNASAFNLNSLRKLSDVRSTDGKTTLLHFVVEEVIRSEGKRCVLNRNQRLSRSFSQSSCSNTSLSSDSNPTKTKEERAKEYIMLGLPVVGCLGVEFSNVKKAAGIDYSTFSGSASGLMNQLSEIRELVLKSANVPAGFRREMEGFLEMAEEEMDSVLKEQENVMEIVKTTTEYYQAGGSRANGADLLQIFVIVKDFLGMVDQACVEIARNLQRSKRAGVKPDSSPEKSPPFRLPVKSPNSSPRFDLQKLSGSASSGSSDSDNDLSP